MREEEYIKTYLTIFNKVKSSGGCLRSTEITSYLPQIHLWIYHKDNLFYLAWIQFHKGIFN